MPFTDADLAQIGAVVDARLKAAGIAVPPPPAPAPAAADPNLFKIGFRGAVTVHSRGGSCAACQTGYPNDHKTPDQIVTGQDPATGAVSFGPDPAFQVDDHARSCGGLLHAVLAEDTPQRHSFYLVCERRECSYTAIKVFEHAPA
jgi:hypothetical protein